MWEELNKFFLMVRSAKGSSPTCWDSAYDFFNEVKLSSHLLEGITVATMSHGEAWHFARMGRLLERADKTSRILDVKYYVLLPTLGRGGHAAGHGAMVGPAGKSPAPWKCIASASGGSCRSTWPTF